MRKKYSVFQEKYSHITSMLNKGFPYADVIDDLKANHQLDLSFNTFRSYLYRYRKELNNDGCAINNAVSKNDDPKSPSQNLQKNEIPNLEGLDQTSIEDHRQTFNNRASGEAFIAKLLDNS